MRERKTHGGNNILLDDFFEIRDVHSTQTVNNFDKNGRVGIINIFISLFCSYGVEKV